MWGVVEITPNAKICPIQSLIFETTVDIMVILFEMEFHLLTMDENQNPITKQTFQRISQLLLLEHMNKSCG